MVNIVVENKQSNSEIYCGLKKSVSNELNENNIVYSLFLFEQTYEPCEDERSELLNYNNSDVIILQLNKLIYNNRCNLSTIVNSSTTNETKYMVIGSDGPIVIITIILYLFMDLFILF